MKRKGKPGESRWLAGVELTNEAHQAFSAWCAARGLQRCHAMKALVDLCNSGKIDRMLEPLVVAKARKEGVIVRV